VSTTRKSTTRPATREAVTTRRPARAGGGGGDQPDPDEPQVTLAVRVPRSVRHRLRRAALETDEQMQAIVLEGLLEALARREHA